MLTRQAVELHYGRCGIHRFEGLNHAINWKSGSQHFSPSSWKQYSELWWRPFICTISQFEIIVRITDNYKIIISYNYSGNKNLWYIFQTINWQKCDIFKWLLTNNPKPKDSLFNFCCDKKSSKSQFRHEDKMLAGNVSANHRCLFIHVICMSCTILTYWQWNRAFPQEASSHVCCYQPNYVFPTLIK